MTDRMIPESALRAFIADRRDGAGDADDRAVRLSVLAVNETLDGLEGLIANAEPAAPEGGVREALPTVDQLAAEFAALNDLSFPYPMSSGLVQHYRNEASRALRALSALSLAPSEPRDQRPQQCRFRLKDEGKSYPRSACRACGKNIGTGLGKHCTFVPVPTPEPSDAGLQRFYAVAAEALREKAMRRNNCGLDLSPQETAEVRLWFEGADAFDAALSAPPPDTLRREINVVVEECGPDARFVEVENSDGASISPDERVTRDQLTVLRFTLSAPDTLRERVEARCSAMEEAVARNSEPAYSAHARGILYAVSRFRALLTGDGA